MQGIKHLFVDTSFFYAVLDKRDRDHEDASRLAQFVQSKQIPLIATWEIIVETVTLLRYRYSYRGATAFIDQILPELNIFYIDADTRARALGAFLKFSRDKRISLCDAISYVVITEHLDFIPSLTFDEDFKQLGLIVLDDIP
jgi:predicted nucleic acid-binding protein